MRAKIFLQKVSGSSLSYNYQYYLASMLYKKLALVDTILANELHSTKQFKFYTFSNIIIEDKKRSEMGLNFNNAHIFLSSPDKNFICSFTDGLLQNPVFRLNGMQLIVKQIEILRELRIDKETYTVYTLSPIYIKTQREVDGKLKEWDLYPMDGKWYENLHQNLVSRYKEYYGYLPTEDFFEILKINSFKGKRVQIDNSFRRCSLLNFILHASKELMKFAYDAGLGEKNAMGFGQIEIKDALLNKL